MTTDYFWECDKEVPEEVKRETQKACKTFKNNPYHSSVPGHMVLD